MKKVIWMALAMLMFGGVVRATTYNVDVEIMTYDEMDQFYKSTKKGSKERMEFLKGRALFCLSDMEEMANEICDPSWTKGGDKKCVIGVMDEITSQRGCNYPELKRKK